METHGEISPEEIAKYERLSELAESDDFEIIGTVFTGQAAASHGREQIMCAAGTDDLDEACRIAVGRPKVGDDRGESPIVRTRVPKAVKEKLKRFSETYGRSEADIVREAVMLYLSRVTV